MKYVGINLGMGRRSGYVAVRSDATGFEIKQAAVQQLKFPQEPNLMMLAALMPNGTAKVVGDDDIPDKADFDLTEITDAA